MSTSSSVRGLHPVPVKVTLPNDDDNTTQTPLILLSDALNAAETFKSQHLMRFFAATSIFEASQANSELFDLAI